MYCVINIFREVKIELLLSMRRGFARDGWYLPVRINQDEHLLIGSPCRSSPVITKLHAPDLQYTAESRNSSAVTTVASVDNCHEDWTLYGQQLIHRLRIPCKQHTRLRSTVSRTLPIHAIWNRQTVPIFAPPIDPS